MAEKTSRLGKIKSIEVPFERADGRKTTHYLVVGKSEYAAINRHLEAENEFVSYNTTAIVVGDSDSPMPGWFIVYGKRSRENEIDNPEIVLAAHNPAHVIGATFFLEGE